MMHPNHWARIENGKVVEITDIDPDGRFAPEFEWHPAPPSVAIGDCFGAGSFSEANPVIVNRNYAEDRRVAYASEADPLKLEAEADAIESGKEPDYSKWMQKRAEIKHRIPKVVTQ
jgi:hypothetical protein